MRVCSAATIAGGAAADARGWRWPAPARAPRARRAAGCWRGRRGPGASRAARPEAEQRDAGRRHEELSHCHPRSGPQGPRAVRGRPGEHPGPLVYAALCRKIGHGRGSEMCGHCSAIMSSHVTGPVTLIGLRALSR